MGSLRGSGAHTPLIRTQTHYKSISWAAAARAAAEAGKRPPATMGFVVNGTAQEPGGAGEIRTSAQLPEWMRFTSQVINDAVTSHWVTFVQRSQTCGRSTSIDNYTSRGRWGWYSRNAWCRCDHVTDESCIIRRCTVQGVLSRACHVLQQRIPT